jgi:hypothetical protein
MLPVSIIRRQLLRPYASTFVANATRGKQVSSNPRAIDDIRRNSAARARAFLASMLSFT